MKASDFEIADIERIRVDIPFHPRCELTTGLRAMGWTVFDLYRVKLRSGVEGVGETTHGYTWGARGDAPLGGLEGRNACEEGCKGNSMCIQEMLTNDFNGRGRWTLIFGGDVDEAELERAVGPILVVGPCAVSQLRAILEQRFRDRRLFFVEACNDLTKNSTYQAHLMKVIPVKMVPVNPITSAWLLMQARLHRTTARLPPIFGLLR